MSVCGTCHVQSLLAGRADARGVGGRHPELVLAVGQQVRHRAVSLLHLHPGD